MKLRTKFVPALKHSRLLEFLGAAVAGILLSVSIAGCVSGCEMLAESPGDDKAGGDAFSVAVWNLQAFFDGTETGLEYDEYLEESGWSAEKYEARLTALGRAVDAMADDAPPVLALVEVENAGVLQTLAENTLSKHGYTWTFFAGHPGNSLGIGILSRYPLFNTRLHSISSEAGVIPRPVLEAWVRAGDEPLALFVCHWKSKLGSEDATEALRRAGARLLLRRIREIEAEAPGTPVIIMGDLNENHDEFYRRSGAVISALLPDDPKAAELAGFRNEADLPAGGEAPQREGQADYLVLSWQKPPSSRYFSQEAVVLYSPWGNEMEKGSYIYRNEWETIDHFLLNGPLFDKQNWEFDACEVLRREPFVSATGSPNSYNPRTGHGLSDHLPLLLTLKFAGAGQ
ncbi:MAG: endonuclease/exonuclease/phosphatase family protein [Spirochaetaceae bacterium]|jgi:endonuclease/exonuclease/phosphatase family metal-dependent hydrolase|nr:endonuclease/exonuclease/phosphatase family protein [Spirochaetaceae bacterium]